MTGLKPRLRKGKHARFSWDEKSEKKFIDIKDALCKEPIFRYSDPELPYYLDTDASAFGVGAVLSQQDPKSKTDYVECYAARVLTETEDKYSVAERELLAVIYALNFFKYWIYGAAHVVRTDARCLKHLFQYLP